jgi:hypothetical protein
MLRWQKTLILMVVAALPGLSGLCAQTAQNTDSLKREMAKQKAANKERAAKMQFQYFVIKAANQTFGYDVYADGNLYLHQSTIPGIGGINGFADTASAGRVARLAINKIKMGEIPPTITPQELKQLKVKVP